MHGVYFKYTWTFMLTNLTHSSSCTVHLTLNDNTLTPIGQPPTLREKVATRAWGAYDHRSPQRGGWTYRPISVFNRIKGTVAYLRPLK